jgi:beta-lactamase class A
MKHSPSRRALLLAIASAPLTTACIHQVSTATRDRLAKLESTSGGRLGVAALNIANGARIDYRSDERFPMCSTFKVMTASAILKQSNKDNDMLSRRIVFSKEELVTYSPITEKHVGSGMTVSDLCAAALRYSDNTAANQLVKLSGGPSSVTAFARSIDDREFRLDRWEPELNAAIPGDARDTSTPAAMARSLHRLALGDALEAGARARLIEWMRGNTTGAAKIRAGVPSGWLVADKTGVGDYGTTNDIAVIEPPERAPIILAVYFTQREKSAPTRNDVIAATTRIVVETFA